MKHDNNLSILILSYDGFSDVWPITFQFFFKHWPDCPYPVYLLTNHKTYQDKRVQNIKIGDDISWSSNLLIGLDQINSDFVLTLFDDFFLNTSVDNSEIERYINLVTKNNFDYFRLRPEPPPDEKINDSYGRITEGALYRVSLCTTIIKKSILKSLLDKDENAWEFEFEGSKRSDNFHHFYSTYQQIIPYYNAIDKGRWRKEVIEIVREYNLDVNKRGICKDKLSVRWKWLHDLKKKILFEIIPVDKRRFFLSFYQKIRKLIFLR